MLQARNGVGSLTDERAGGEQIMLQPEAPHLRHCAQ